MSSKYRSFLSKALTAVAVTTLLISGNTVPANAVAPTANISVAVPAAKTNVAKVKTTANLNMRSGSSTKHKVLKTVPEGKPFRFRRLPPTAGTK